MSPDPKYDEHFEDTQGWNIYSYCENSPVLRWDPDGMDWIDDALIGAYKGLSKVPVVGATMRLTAAATNQTVDSDGVKAVGDAKTRWTQAGSATLQLALDSAQVLSGGGMAATVRNVALDTAVGVAEGAASGEFRGGSHSQTTKPRGDGLDSHHTPPEGTGGVRPADGPAIQMDPKDHKATSSYGRSAAADAWREGQEKLSKTNPRRMMANEVRDVRRAAGAVSGSQSKYNKALQQMLKYAKKTYDLVKKKTP